MNSWLITLPPEIKKVIVSALDIPDIFSVRATGCDLKSVVDTSTVWKFFAGKIGCCRPIDDRVENWRMCVKNEVIKVRRVAGGIMQNNGEVITLIREKALGTEDVIRLKYLLEKLKFENLRKFYGDFHDYKFPGFVEELLSKKFPNIEVINELNGWLKARDTMVFWNCLRSEAKFPLMDFQFEILSKPKEYMGAVPMFEKWFQDNITKLQAVERLELYKNLISFLPDELWQLESLKFLSLGCNQIANISEDIVNLTSLERLFIYDNQLIDLPDKITDIKTLVECNLLYNIFPKDLKFCQKLKENGVELYF